MSEYLWKKQDIEGSNQTEKKSRVLVLYTGGTIGMKWTDKGYSVVKSYLESKIRTFPMFNDTEYAISETDSEVFGDINVIPLPHRILYGIKEYSPLLDSSNMSMNDWAKIANDIDRYYSKFDAFIILHGTDTMAYTASALSFMLENLGKTVILTGSQIPLSELRNDGRDNFQESLIIAGEYVIPEVLLYFNNKLFRGNRTVKMNSSRLNAFTSPNIPPLATVGIDIDVVWDAIFRPYTTEKFRVHSEMNTNVGILRLFPGITQAAVRSFLRPPMEGVVLQSYGAGNVPDTRLELLEELKSASDRGVIIVNCTQCSSGYVSEKYAAGTILREADVIPGHDMTPEAALTKLSYLLSKKDFGLAKRRELMEQNIRGEMTVLEERTEVQFCLQDANFLQSVAKMLHVTSNKEIRKLRGALFPPLMCTAAAKGDLEALKSLQKEGGDLNLPDYAGLTPLHLAAREGHYDVVHFLLTNGASVHMRDTFNHAPLYGAIKFKHLDVIKLLIQTGAHIIESSVEIGAKLCQAVALQDITQLEAWRLAGADLNTPDYSGNTALSIAHSHQYTKVIDYLTGTKDTQLEIDFDAKLEHKERRKSSGQF